MSSSANGDGAGFDYDYLIVGSEMYSDAEGEPLEVTLKEFVESTE